MVTTNQKPTTDTKKTYRKRNTNIPQKKIIEQQGKKLKEEENNREELQKQPEKQVAKWQ